MNTDEPLRVRYYDQQPLQARDLADEQAYHLGLHRRHNISGHEWGIVSGLEIALGDDDQLIVTPGVAVDGFGRELILTTPETRSASQIFTALGRSELEIFLAYAQRTTTSAGTAAKAPWTPPQADRVQEYAELVICRSSERDYSNHSRPYTDDEGCSGPEQPPPDDPQEQWLVFLGRVRRSADGKAPTVDLSGRPYAGLRGNLVYAPSGEAWLQVGGQDDNGYAFGIFLDDPAGRDEWREDRPVPVLGVKGSAVELNAQTTVAGDLTIDGGALVFGAGPEPADAKPWQLYHVAGGTVEQLRVEMAEPAGGALHEVVIGQWSSSAGAFQPCLTITAATDAHDGVVTVHGDLDVGEADKAKPQQLQSSLAAALKVQDQRELLIETFVSAMLLYEAGRQELIYTFVSAVLEKEEGRIALIDALGKSKFIEEIKDKLNTE